MENTKINISVGFWAIAVIFLLWNITGVLSFFGHIFITEESLAKLPINERELFGDFSIWTTSVFAIAVFGGLLGSIGLLLKKKWAKTAFIISLIAIIPHVINNVFFTKAVEVYGPGQAMTIPIMVFASGVFIVWYSNMAINKKWLK